MKVITYVCIVALLLFLGWEAFLLVNPRFVARLIGRGVEVRGWDGSHRTVYANGTEVVTYKDGQIRVLPCGTGQPATYPAGTGIVVYLNGSRKITYRDKREVVTHLDGVEVTTYPDGRQETRLGSGTLMTTYRDGREKIRQNNGVTMTTYPGGRQQVSYEPSYYHRLGVISLNKALVSLGPVIEDMPVGMTYRIKGHLTERGSSPFVPYFRLPDGQVKRARVEEDGKSFEATLIFEKEGYYAIEVCCEDRFLGGSVACKLGVKVGHPPPLEPILLTIDRLSSIDTAERRMVDLINADRIRLGFSPLHVDRRLSTMAHAHSQDMRKAGFVGHRSPTRGIPIDRAKRLGLNGVAENCGMNFSIEDAELAVLLSAGHRANLLRPEWTHVGVGIAVRHDTLWYSQEFARLSKR